MKERPLTSLLLTIDETAEQLRMSPGYVRKEIREGRLARVKLGVAVRVEYSEIVRYVESKRVVENAGSPCVYRRVPAIEPFGYLTDLTTGSSL